MDWNVFLGGKISGYSTAGWAVDLRLGPVAAPTTITFTWGEMLKQLGFLTGEDRHCWPPFDASGLMGCSCLAAEKFYMMFNSGGFAPMQNARIGVIGLLKEGCKGLTCDISSNLDFDLGYFRLECALCSGSFCRCCRCFMA